MRTLTCTFGVALVLFGLTADASGADKTRRAKFDSFDAAKDLIFIETDSGVVLPFRPAKDMKVLVDGKAAKLDDLQRKWTVDLVLTDKNRVTEIRAYDKEKPPAPK